MKECTAASEWMQFFYELNERQLRTLQFIFMSSKKLPGNCHPEQLKNE
ncbi:hypothetical protein [Cytobacillus firmus]